jgi:hypothetical protein
MNDKGWNIVTIKDANGKVIQIRACGPVLPLKAWKYACNQYLNHDDRSLMKHEMELVASEYGERMAFVYGFKGNRELDDLGREWAREQSSIPMNSGDHMRAFSDHYDGMMTNTLTPLLIMLCPIIGATVVIAWFHGVILGLTISSIAACIITLMRIPAIWCLVRSWRMIMVSSHVYLRNIHHHSLVSSYCGII